MFTIGIDPSYSSCGVAVYNDANELVGMHTIKESGKCYGAMADCDKAANKIAESLCEIVGQYGPSNIIIEYPALATRSGAYLAILHGFIISKLLEHQMVDHLYMVGPQACDSFIKNTRHSKTYIVEYCKEHKWVPNTRVNNDICTASVLCHILWSILDKRYKNSWSKIY